MIANWFARWRRSAAEIAVLLLFLHLPIVALHKFASWILIMEPWEMTKELALIVTLYGLAAGLIGLAIASVESLLGIIGDRLARYWHALCLTLLGLVVVLTLVLPTFTWWKGVVASLPGPTIMRPAKSFLALLGVLAVLVLLTFLRRGWISCMEGFSARLCGARRHALVLVGLGTLLAIFTGQLHWQSFGWASRTPIAARADAPNIILISIDTLSAKDMSLYGHSLPTTPNIDALATKAFVFEHFYANSNYTIPTIATMLTGRYPSSHRVTQLRGRLSAQDSARTLAHALQAGGYVTATVVANDAAHPMYQGFSEAFDYQAAPAHDAPGAAFEPLLQLIDARAFHWIWDWWSAPYTHVLFPALKLDRLQARNWFPAEEVISAALEGASAERRPLFLWAHFMSPHEPYLPPAPFLGRFMPPGEFDRYDEQVGGAKAVMGGYPPTSQPLVDKLRLRYDEYIAYTDDAVQKLLEGLRGRGVLDNAILVITADHGQSFEKGFHGHRGPLLHDALINIPFVIQVPGQTEGRRIAAEAEQVDLLPTLLDLAGLPVPDWAQGESLAPVLAGGAPSGRPKFSFDLERESRFLPPRRGNFAVIQGRKKFVYHQSNGCEELYDLAGDPQETRNLVLESSAEQRAQWRKLLEEKIGTPVQPGTQPCPP